MARALVLRNIGWIGPVVFACSACVAGTTGAGVDRIRDPVTPAELEETGLNNLYDALRRIRPAWLTNLGGVYTDGFQAAGRGDATEWLRSTTPARVERIDVLSCEEKMTRFGGRCLNQQYIHVIYIRDQDHALAIPRRLHRPVLKLHLEPEEEQRLAARGGR